MTAWAILMLTGGTAWATISTDVRTFYDIDSNHASSYAAFDFSRSAFDGANYEFEVTHVLSPYDWYADNTFLDSWSHSFDVLASENDHVYSLIAVQQYDAATGQYLDGQSSQSGSIVIPVRTLVMVYENWPNWLYLNSAGWYPVGSPYGYCANDYSDMVFVGWSGNVDSAERCISGTLNSTSFTLVASYQNRPPKNPCPAGGCVENPGEETCPQGGCPNTPIVLKLENGPYELSGLSAAPLFERRTWRIADSVSWPVGTPRLNLAR